MSDEAGPLLEHLLRKAKKPSRDAATLTHNIGIAAQYLETRWDDKAKQIIGALVVVNGDLMYSSVWAALFQHLRDSEKLAVKVYMLKQFANICWAVPTKQGENAFRAFVLALRPLLSNIQILTSLSFQQSFSIITDFFGKFSDQKLVDEMYNALYNNLLKCSRMDGIRATSTVIAMLSAHVPRCLRVEQILERAKFDLELSSYAVLLDTLVSTEALQSKPHTSRQLRCFQEEVYQMMEIILSSWMDNEKAIPPCVNAYRRLKQLRSSWEPPTAELFTRRAIKALGSEETGKLLICPLLQFFQHTSTSWWHCKSVVWKLADSTDPFVRADALLALAHGSQNLVGSEKMFLLKELMGKLHRYVSERCSLTSVAILKFIETLVSDNDVPFSEKTFFVSQLAHMCRQHGMCLHDNIPSQVELLSIFHLVEPAPEVVASVAVELFLTSNDRAACAKAFEVLLSLSTHTLLDAASMSQLRYGKCRHFYESSRENIAGEDVPLGLFPTQQLQQQAVLADLINARVYELPENDARESMNYLVACDASKKLCESNCAYNPQLCLTTSGSLSLFSHILSTQHVTSSDVYISLVQACTACVTVKHQDRLSDISVFAALVKQSWSAIVECLAASSATIILEHPRVSYRFFRVDCTPVSCRDIIVKCRDVALMNEVSLVDSVFHNILDCNLKLLTACVSSLRDDLLFVAELRQTLSNLFRCCTALFYCSPNSVLNFLTTVLSFIKDDLPATIPCMESKRPVLVEITRCSNAMVSKAISMDMRLFNSELCNFLHLYIQLDIHHGKALFGELIAQNWTIVSDLVEFCRWNASLKHTNEYDIFLLRVLRVLFSFCDSIYRDNFLESTPRKTFAELLSFFEEAPWFEEKKRCIFFISQILSAYDGNRSIDTQLECCFLRELSGSDFFDQLDLVVELWNSSRIETQKKIQSKLVCSPEVEKLVCAAALDELCIPLAVRAVLQYPTSAQVFDVLLLIIEEAQCDHLPLIPFFVSSEVIEEGGKRVYSLLRDYPWGWCVGPETVKMLLSEAWRKSTLSTLVSFGKRESLHNEDHTSAYGILPKDFCLLSSTAIVDGSFWQSFPGLESVEMLHFLPNQHLSLAQFTEVLLFQSPQTPQLLIAANATPNELLHFFSPTAMRLFAASISTFDLTPWAASTWICLLQWWTGRAQEAPIGSELSWLLQSCCWALLTRVEELTSPVLKQDFGVEAETSVEPLTTALNGVFLQLASLFFCSCDTDVDDVALRVLRYGLHLDAFFSVDSVAESIFWSMAARLLCKIWEYITAEIAAPLHDPLVVAFLCRVHTKMQFPLSVQKEIHALFTPLLLSYGTGATDMTQAELKRVLWLVSGLRCGYSEFGAFDRICDAQRTSFEVSSDISVDSSREAAVDSSRHALPPATSADGLELSGAIRRVLLQVIRTSFSNVASFSPEMIQNAIEVSRKLMGIWNRRNTFTPQQKNSFGEDEVYHLMIVFLEQYSPLMTEATIDPPAHCLCHLLQRFPAARPLSFVLDSLALESSMALMTEFLYHWLDSRRPGVSPPAQLPCVLALHLPFLIRCDIPSYTCALQCLRLLSVLRGTPEVEALFQVAFPRLLEDFADVRWECPVAECWCKCLILFMGGLAVENYEGNAQQTRRIWESLWQGAGMREHPYSLSVGGYLRKSIQQFAGKVTPNSAQWNLCQLVMLDEALHRSRSSPSPSASESCYDSESSFRLIAVLRDCAWQMQLLQTQCTFVQHSVDELDSDSSRSLLFEFESAVAPLCFSPTQRSFLPYESGAACVMVEQSRGSKVSFTDSVLSALNHFEFSVFSRRRDVLRELAHIMLSRVTHSESNETLMPSWSELYFDVLYERATCCDEGLWVVCALAATVFDTSSQISWCKKVLTSLLPASTTAWKHELLTRINCRAKDCGSQDHVRQFFLQTTDRLAALRTAPSSWKSELLVAATSLFT